MSKGSKRRPMSISEQVFKDNWAVIFGAEKRPVKNCHDGMVLHFDGDGGVLEEEECQVNRTCEWIKLSMTGEDDYWQAHCMEHGAKGDVMLTDRLSDYCPNCGGEVEVYGGAKK